MKFTEEEKAMWVDDWKQSGKSAWAYAKENNLNPQSFVKWTKSETKNKDSFVEVPSHFVQTQMPMPEILIEKGELKIHIPLSFGRSELWAIMERLGCVL